ncbi:ATP-dependent helicase HrpA [Marinomonas sp. A3A]|nr:ATP-dependent helicase HrpA [Marinomonas sp. A3A]
MKQRSLELQKQTLESLELLDHSMAETIRMASIAQSEKLIVDTRNSITNGYVDSANKANNANTQNGKGINF